MSDEASAASLRKSGRTRKRPLAPDAAYEQSPTGPSKSLRISYSATPMPFSPDKAFGGDLGQAMAGSSAGLQTPNGNGVEGENDDDEEPEEEPVWAEFSADYYQVVEQLPLELHRNFALLRELDEQTQRQTSQLLELIRQYANARLSASRTDLGQPTKPPRTPSKSLHKDLNHPLPDLSTLKSMGDNHMDIDTLGDLPTTPGKGQSDRQFPSNGDTAAGPSRHVDAIPEAHLDVPLDGQSGGNTLYSVKLTSNMLPQIGQLARDVLRGADEKVGIANGCLHSVDRHVRTIHTALQTQQAAVNLGIEAGTLPSEMVTGSTGLGASGAVHADTQQAMGIFSGARERGLNGTAGDGIAIDGLNVGLADSRMGPGRAKKDDAGPHAIVAGYIAAQNFDLALDPDEPRYCYCENVSHGEMLGCENDDCPHGGWFHLTCLGLTTAPKNLWWCDSCKPAGDNAGTFKSKKPKNKKKSRR